MENTSILLSEYFADSRARQLPDSVQHAAKRLLLDVAGTAIAGAADRSYSSITGYAKAFCSPGPIPGPGGHYDITSAAFLAGAAAHVLDYDDSQPSMGGHPSATIFPVVASLGYLLRSSGSEVLRAIVHGVEMDSRLGDAMNPALYSSGWHPTSVIGTMGACVAACSLLRFDADAIRKALGAAASFASGTKANFGTTIKSLHAGMAGRAGMQAALLVKSGVSANDHIFEEQSGGYLDLFASGADRSKLIESLGSSFAIEDPGVGFKLLPCCASVQSTVWATIELFQKGLIDTSSIKALRAYVDELRMPHTNRPIVTTGLEAKFSSQYCQAVAALTGKLTIADFDDDVVCETARQDLMKRTSILVATDSASWDRPDQSATGSRGAYVEVEDYSGNVISNFQPAPLGNAGSPPEDSVLTSKFEDCASRSGRAPERIKMLENTIMTLENIPDFSVVVEDIWNND